MKRFTLHPHYSVGRIREFPGLHEAGLADVRPDDLVLHAASYTYYPPLRPKAATFSTPGGQTGTVDKSGHIEEVPVPSNRQSGPPRAAYLAVFDARTGESLWTDSHQWGGLLTSHNSAGACLISQLKKEMKK